MRTRLLFGLLGLVVMLGAASSSAAAPSSAWNAAIEVPGTATLNSGANAGVIAISCGTAGNCAAGGLYTDASAHSQAFVVDETIGSWGTAVEVPGTDALNTGGSAAVAAVSCPTAGNCAAGGHYRDSSNHYQAFIADETNGTWGSAIEVPGTATLNAGGNADVLSVSCPTAGNCTAGGFYRDGSGHLQAFTVAETNGSWGTASEVPGTATLNSGSARVYSVSCASAGNCAAGGFYSDGAGHSQAFVADETNGTWGNAIEVPGTATLNGGGNATVVSLSCPTAGNCTAAGHYTDGATFTEAFVVDETNGTWGTAIEVPGTEVPNSGRYAEVRSVSCTTAGNCSAGGLYTDGAGHSQAFVVNEVSGSWSTAIEVPGTATLNSSGNAGVQSVSCVGAGNCAAGGYYNNGSGTGSQAFVVGESNGTWATAVQVPGTAALNSGKNASLKTLSCAGGDCAAGGGFVDGSGAQAFVVSSGAVAATTLTPAPAGGMRGGTTTLYATLLSGGNFVPNETVTFSLNGTNVGSATTNAIGVATLQNVSLAGIAPGSYPTGVAASFDGNGSPGSASSGSSSLTVYPAGLVGLRGVSVNTKAGKVDSFDSSLGPYSSSNHGSAAAVLSNGSLGLTGVALLGSATSTQGAVAVASTSSVSGNVTAGTTATVSGTVGGTVTQNSPSIAIAAPTVSACSPFSAKTGISGGTFAYSRTTGNLTVKYGTVKLASKTYCFHTIALAAGTKLSVSGPVTIHLTGRITGAAGHIVNTTNNPTNLRISTSYSGSGGLTIAGGVHAYMTILAPGATVTIPSGGFFGTVLAGNVSLTGSSAFHADSH